MGWVMLVLGHEAWATLDPSKRILWLAFPQEEGGYLELLPWLTWGLLPAAFAAWRSGGFWLDRDWFGVQRWTSGDAVFLGAAAVIASASIFALKHVPALSEHYRTLASFGEATPAVSRQYFLESMFWVLSWLPLWEFMMRGLLLPFCDKAWPKYGWLVVPLLETAFHGVKPWPEALGMLVFSLVATQWVRQRRNLLLPFLAHLGFEVVTFGYVAFG